MPLFCDNNHFSSTFAAELSAVYQFRTTFTTELCCIVCFCFYRCAFIGNDRLDDNTGGSIYFLRFLYWRWFLFCNLILLMLIPLFT